MTIIEEVNIWSFPTGENRVGYLISEKGYEAEDGAHNTHWSVSAIGDRARMVNRISQMSSNIARGRTLANASPEAFTTGMLELLHNPRHLSSTTVTLSNSLEDLHPAITAQNRARVQEILMQMGKPELAQEIALSGSQGGCQEIKLDLAVDLDLVQELTTVIYPWTIIRSNPLSDQQGIAEAMPEAVDSGEQFEVHQSPPGRINNSEVFA